MNTHNKIGLVVVALLLVSMIRPTRAYSADYYFGNFDAQATYPLINSYSDPTRTGWYDISTLQTSANTSTTIGVTTGTQSLAWQPGSVGYYQGLTYKLQIDPKSAAEREATIQAMLANTHLAMNVSWDRNEWVAQHNGDITSSNYSLVQMVINYGPGGQYISQGAPDIDTGNNNFKGGWDPVNYTTPTHTRVVMWDYTDIKSQLQGFYTAGTTTGSAGWLEFILVTNAGDYNYPVTYYIDSVRFTTPLPGDYNGDGTVDAADYVLWRNGGPLQNDFTAGVTPSDYDVWRANFGKSAPSGAAAGLASASAVPEPSVWLLAIVAIGVLSLRPASWTRIAKNRALCVAAARRK